MWIVAAGSSTDLIVPYFILDRNVNGKEQYFSVIVFECHYEGPLLNLNVRSYKTMHMRLYEFTNSKYLHLVMRVCLSHCMFWKTLMKN